MEHPEPLFDAVLAGDTQTAQKILKENPHFINHLHDSGATLLLLAAYTRNEEMIHALRPFKDHLNIYEAAALGEFTGVVENLAEMDDIDAPAPDGFTALGLAVFFGHDAIARLLLVHGANPNKPSANKMVVTPLHSAAATQNLELVQLLLDRGADPNAQQPSGVAPLHSAAHTGQLEICKRLLRAGANPALRTHAGETALDFAQKDGFPEIAALLLPLTTSSN